MCGLSQWGRGKGWVQHGLHLTGHLNGPPVSKLRDNRTKDRDCMCAVINFNISFYHCNAITIFLILLKWRIAPGEWRAGERPGGRQGEQ